MDSGWGYGKKNEMDKKPVSFASRFLNVTSEKLSTGEIEH